VQRKTSVNWLIKLFGSPGGLCSSITESKHITAVKEPWRRSNRYNALGQMLLTNQRLDKLAASRVDFEHRGMLNVTSIFEAISAQEFGLEGDLAFDGEGGGDGNGNADGGGDGNDDNEAEVDGPKTVGHVELGIRSRAYNSDCPKQLTDPCGSLPERGYPWEVTKLGRQIGQPHLQELIRRFPAEQLRQPEDDDFHDIPLSECPHFYSRISVFPFASATFYAPSDLSGINGMRHERIYSCPSWRRAILASLVCVAFMLHESSYFFPSLSGTFHIRVHWSNGLCWLKTLLTKIPECGWFNPSSMTKVKV
jgi:hypothetical protein